MACRLWFDGASRGNGRGSTLAGYGFVLDDPSGEELARASVFLGFNFTNNQAEYKALIAGLIKARSLNVGTIRIFGDSNLVVNQVNQDWQIRNETLGRYCSEVWKLLRNWFSEWRIEHVGREYNRVADSLAQEGVDKCRNEDDFRYGWYSIIRSCYHPDKAWKYLLNQRIHGYWRIKFMLEVIEHRFPGVYDSIQERCCEELNDGNPDLAYLLVLL